VTASAAIGPHCCRTGSGWSTLGAHLLLRGQLSTPLQWTAQTTQVQVALLLLLPLALLVVAMVAVL
jgi:hypothetical protein